MQMQVYSRASMSTLFKILPLVSGDCPARQASSFLAGVGSGRCTSSEAHGIPVGRGARHLLPDDCGSPLGAGRHDLPSALKTPSLC
jgi:hypothetical protein